MKKNKNYFLRLKEYKMKELKKRLERKKINDEIEKEIFKKYQ